MLDFETESLAISVDLGAESTILISNYDSHKDYKDTLGDRLGAWVEDARYGDHNTFLYFTVDAEGWTCKLQEQVSIIVTNYIEEAAKVEENRSND